MKYYVVFLSCLFLSLPRFASSQSTVSNGLHYEVNKIYPSVSVTKEQLSEAHTLNDINPRYKSSWVRTYYSVEVLTYHNGSIKQVVGKSDILSQAQKDLIKMADTGTDISVKVRYLPENNLKHNEAKEMGFTFSINPDNDAAYVGGTPKLMQYLKENTINKIPDTLFTGYKLAAIKFTIDEAGQITDSHIFSTSEDEKIDQLLLATICNMPDWNPATYADGTKVKQEFAFTLGNMESCVVNLLNIRR